MYGYVVHVHVSNIFFPVELNAAGDVESLGVLTGLNILCGNAVRSSKLVIVGVLRFRQKHMYRMRASDKFFVRF